MTKKTNKYSCFSELAASEKEGNDYKLIAYARDGASVVIIAPHGGGIERGTGEIAQDIAGTDFSFYSFCGLKRKGNWDLHITSHKFDEPMCLEIVAKHRWVIAIHGCSEKGEKVFLGGLDREFISVLVVALRRVGILAETDGHEFTATHPNNICNRGITKTGVQFELSLPFRKSSRAPAFVAAVREVLLKRQNGT